MSEEYRVSELAEKAGVTKRTIHYYISRGLIPPPEGMGVGSTYREEHLVRILLVKKLQEQYLPLDRIRQIMASLSLEQVKQSLDNESANDIKAYKDDKIEEGLSCEPSLCGLNLDRNTENFSETPVSENPAALSKYKTGVEYIRVELGLSIELHCPSGIYEKHRDLINNIEKYARRLIEEK